MTKYLVLYKSTATAAEQMAVAQTDPAAATAAMEMWNQWAARVGDALVDIGTPLNDVASVPDGSGGGGLHIGGYSILQADSAAAATGLLTGHPHFHAPGASIEVLEHLAMPGAGG